jgi:transposase
MGLIPSAGSLSQVIHQSAEGASAKCPSPTIVNNFAADKMSVGDKLVASVSADGGNASDVARSCFAHRKTVQRRTPARSQASTQRSDRTQAREALSTSSTRGGGQSLPLKATTNTKRMNPHQTLTHYAGFDWAKDHHDIIVIDLQGQIVADFRIDHTPAGWRLWKEKIAYWPQLGVAIETNFGAAVEQLLESGVSLYPVNPMNAKRYRERQCSSGNKTDRHDAWALADALRMDGHAWRPLGAADPILAELRILCRDEVALIEERTALINQLQQALHEYYPTALEAFDDWISPGAWAFVEAFPDAQALEKAGKRKWEKFLHSHRLYRTQTYDKRMAAFENAGQWKSNAALVAAKSLLAVARCKQLRVLQGQLDVYRQRIEALFASHPDSNLFGSLPGAGPKLGPRLLSEIGSDRALYEDPQGLQCMAGTAPVSYQSGKVHKVNIRRGCNKNLRHSMYLFADKSRAQSAWASKYYDALRERGKSHAQALRCLGQRWLKIIWKMWQTHTPYDAELHMKNQLAHGSWVLQLSPQ